MLRKSLLLSLWVVVFTACFFSFAGAVELSSQQQQMLEQLSPAEKAALAKKYGVSLSGAAAEKAEITTPQVVIPQKPETSTLEQDLKQTKGDRGSERAAVANGAAVDTPVARIEAPALVERSELRRGFADFVAESKPLTVATDLQQFGYELFAGTPTTFAPATDIPIPAEYVLGPGDELKVQLFGKLDQQLAMVVDREGVIAFPEIGPLNVAGMNFAEARAFIAEQINEKTIGISASITMGALRSIRIFALGEVARPGSYLVSGLATLSQALFVSGGVKKIGSLRNIQLKRNGQLVTSIDLYDFLLKGDTSADVRLLPGDVVFVPPIGPTVGVAGEVTRPAIYELRQEQRLAEVLTLAGGLRPTAYRAQSLIERVTERGGREVLEVALQGADLERPLQSQDLLKVFSVLDFEENPVFLIGNVKRPGKYAWQQGLRLSALLPSAEELLPETYLDYGLIEREAADTRETELVRFRLTDLFSGELESDLLLQPRDKVYVFHRAHFRQQPLVEVSGQVQSPGRYELKRSMRLADLLLASGGLLRDADRSEAELYRTDPLSKDVHLSRYSLEAALAGGDGQNPLLQDLDRLVVHSLYEKREREVVTLQGEVKKPGKFKRAINMRVSDLIFAAGGLTLDALVGPAQLYRTDPETQDVSLLNIDIEKALAGADQHNLLLQDLDRLVVHSLWETKQRYRVSVVGEIKKPGDYELAEGMRVADLVFASGNVTDRAYLKSAEITRYQVIDGEQRASEHLQLDLAAALQGDVEANLPLRPYDVLTVRTVSNWRQAEQVSLFGEIKYPGSYPIEDGERLSAVLARAGGFLPPAYLPAAVFTRESIRADQQRQIDEMTRRIEKELAQLQVSTGSIRDAQLLERSQKSQESAQRVLEQMRKVKATGRLVIQLSDLQQLKGSPFDLRLRDGDRLHVPKRPDEVHVIGQVYNQAALVYRPDWQRNDYLQRAGGPTRFADDKQIYVVRANGEVDPQRGWRKKRIRPGDVIVVPEELERFNLLDSSLDWSRVLMQLGIGIASMKTLDLL